LPTTKRAFTGGSGAGAGVAAAAEADAGGADDDAEVGGADDDAEVGGAEEEAAGADASRSTRSGGPAIVPTFSRFSHDAAARARRAARATGARMEEELPAKRGRVNTPVHGRP